MNAWFTLLGLWSLCHTILFPVIGISMLHIPRVCWFLRKFNSYKSCSFSWSHILFISIKPLVSMFFHYLWLAIILNMVAYINCDSCSYFHRLIPPKNYWIWIQPNKDATIIHFLIFNCNMDAMFSIHSPSIRWVMRHLIGDDILSYS